jgi:hypothetical protein
MNARSLAADIQHTTEVLAPLERALGGGFEPGEVVAVSEAKVKRLRRHLLRFEQRISEISN